MAEEMGSDREGLINQAMFMFARLNGFLDAGGGDRASPPVLTPAHATPSSGRGGARDGTDRKEARRREVEERVLETAAKLERDIKSRSRPEPPAPVIDDDDLFDDEDDLLDDDEIDDDDVVEEMVGESLYLMTEDGELDKITKDRFLIGRGKHCDFIIQSGKVSREHAVIVHEDDGYYIEDLGSSNGTWYNKKRIKRRKIEDGDEYYICSEKVKMVIR